MLLLWAGGEHVIGYFETGKEWLTSQEGFNDWTTGAVTTTSGYDCGFNRIRPTHWMALPPEPSNGKN
jgi:hypothetical protein